MQVKTPKGVLSERKAFASCAAARRVKIACEKKILIYEI